MTKQELDDAYMAELKKIQETPSIGAGDAQLRSMAMNELRRWYERELRQTS